jgi:hypothetical protein
MAMMAFAAAQAPPPADTKKWKNDEEQKLGLAAVNEKDPAAKIEALDKWKAAFPDSDYAEPRLGQYLATYGQLKRYHDQIMVAEELRKKFPDNLDLLRMIFSDEAQIKPPSPEDLAAVVDAATFIVNHADDVFAPAKKPKDQTDAQWAQFKPQMVAYANNQLDVVAETKGEDAVIERLKADPTRVALNVWLGKEILDKAKTNPEVQTDAIYHYARAAAYTGPGALDPKARDQMKSFVDRAYKTYHGSPEGEDKLMAAAASSALPNGFKIDSTVDVAKKAEANDAQFRADHPIIAQWRDVKAILVADGGDAKFASDIKDSALPKFRGKIVSMTPAIRPKTVVVLVDEKDGTQDCTLTFATPLPGKMEAGEELEFEGVAKSFTKDPYMLTLEVEKDKLTGWTGKNAPPRPGAGKMTKKPGN